jgi:hypothetical protein
MKNIFYIFFIASLIACRIEDKDGPKPEDSFIKYYGQASTTYEMVDMEIIYSDETKQEVVNIILLGTRTVEDQRSDIYLLKTDAAGIFVADAAFSYDGDSEDVAKQISMAGDNILVVGNTTTSISSGGLQGVVWNEFTTELIPVSQPSTDTELYSIFSNPANPKRISGNDIIQTSDGNFVLVGNYITQTNDQQYYRLKIDATQKGHISYPSNPSNSDNALMWFVSGGVGAFDDLINVFEENGGLVFIGNSTHKDSKDAAKGGINVRVIAANSLGVTVNEGTYGLNPKNRIGQNFPDANDLMRDAIQMDGGYAITGTTSFGNDSRAFFISVGSNASLQYSNILTSSFTLSPDSIDNHGIGITRGIRNDFIIVGQYPDFRTDNGVSKAAEAMFYRTNQIGEPIYGFESNYGLIAGDDIAVVAKTLPDGKILVGSTIDFGSGSTLLSLIKLNDNGQLDN